MLKWRHAPLPKTEVLAPSEYPGSYSSVVKLFIENLGFPSLMSGKPVALLGVGAGQIGATKALEHLRSVCFHYRRDCAAKPVLGRRGAAAS